MDNILSVGKNKGEMDFAISATISDLSQEQMAEFREMIVVAIGVAEQMWRSNRREDCTPFDPKPDTEEWIHHKMTDESWAEWRKENVEKLLGAFK